MVLSQKTRRNHRQTLSHNVVYVIYVNYITIWCLPGKHGETHTQTLSHNVVYIIYVNYITIWCLLKQHGKTTDKLYHIMLYILYMSII
jgi:hypothetical protein